MTFGASITPRFYQDRTPRKGSRLEHFLAIHRALVMVGMKPIVGGRWGVSVFDDWDESEIFMAGGFSNALGTTAYYDFPDAQEWEIDGKTVRPIIALHMGYQEYSYSSTYGHQGIYVDYRLRDAGDPAAMGPQENTWDYNSGRGYTEYAHWGNISTNTYSYYFTDHAGHIRYNGQWAITKFGQAYNSGWRDTFYPLANVEAFLGPAGLFLRVGGGKTKDSAGNYLDLALVFVDHRLPGRQKPEVDDYDKAHTVPIVNLDFREDGGIFNWGDVWNQLRGKMLGVTYTNARTRVVKDTVLPVMCATFPLDSYDRPLPYWSPRVQNSPQAIADEGRHILSPLCTLHRNLYTDSTDTYADTDPLYAFDYAVGRWEEVYYTPHVCFTDPTAPYAFFDDPDSGEEWWCFRMEEAETMLAVRTTGALKLTPANPLPVHPVLYEEHLDVTSGIPVGDNGTVVTVAAMSSTWTYQAGEDRLENRITTQTNQDVSWEFTLDISGDPVGTIYEMVYEAKATGPESQAWYNNISTTWQYGWGAILFMSYDGPWGVNTQAEIDANAIATRQHAITSLCPESGNGSGRTYKWNQWNEYVAPIWPDANGVFRPHWRVSYVDGTLERTFELRNIRIRKRQANY